MLERLHGEDRERWLTELDSPLPGETTSASSAHFDDGYHQINQ